MERIVILTGAGISAESGLATFRDAQGLWAAHRIEDVATPEAFARDPQRVRAFYDTRRRDALAAMPNAAHHALARLMRARPGAVTLVTQNIDDLHERAGATPVIHMHGEIRRAICAACGHRWMFEGERMEGAACPACRGGTGLRPDVVWFGEIPYAMDEIAARLAEASLFVAIGTSGAVYPAAGFVQEARAQGADTLEINLDETETSAMFEQRITGRASEAVPTWVDSLIGPEG